MKLNHLITFGTTSVLIATFSAAGYGANLTHVRLPSLPGSTHTIVTQRQSNVMMSGSFVAAEKPTTGMAKIVKEGGHYYVELDGNFSTSDQGPDLHVLLDTSNQPPQTYKNPNSAVNLGKLHNFSGTQRYPIPDSINPSEFKSVVIWCRMANATFGYAPLRPASSASR